MRRILWLLALGALAVAISLLARYNEGYLLLVLPPYRAELSLNLALLLILLVFVLLHALLRGIVHGLALPARVRRFRARRHQEKAAAAWRDALRRLFEGRFAQALKKAGEAHATGHWPALAALLAAHAAQQLGAPDKAKAWLDRARHDDPQMAVAQLMLEAEGQLAGRDFLPALATLQRLQCLAGRHIAALRLELRAQQGCGNWPEVLRLVRRLEKRGALPAELAQELRFKAHRENIRQQRADRGPLLEYLRRLPARENSARLTHLLAEALLENGAVDEAQQLIEDQLAVQWDAGLLGLYGRLPGSDPGRGIARGESWLPEHPDDAPLLLALGRLCLAQRLWGKAQSYLEASLALAEQREVRLALARLCEQSGRPAEALPHYRAAAGLPP